MKRVLASVCFALALSIQPAAVRAQSGNPLEQADAAFRAGDLDKASVLARKALAQNPGAVHAHLILGIISAQGRQWKEAETHFQSIIKLDPKNPFASFYLGQAKLYQQQWAPAAANFAKALASGYPDKDRLYIEMALAQDESGQPQAALDSLSKVAAPASGPLAAQYHSVRASALGKLNKSSEAIESMKRARELDDSSPHSYESMITSLISLDEMYKAHVEAIQAQKKFPDDAQIQYLFALTTYYVTESPLTKLALRNLREADPDSPRVLLVEGLLYRKQGQGAKAMKAFTAAAAKGVPDAHLLLGILHKEDGNYDAAEKEYRLAEETNPKNGQIQLEMGKLLLVKGDLKEAQIRLEKALASMPDAPGVHYQLGLLYGRLGDTQKAQQHLKLSRQAN